MGADPARSGAPRAGAGLSQQNADTMGADPHRSVAPRAGVGLSQQNADTIRADPHRSVAPRAGVGLSQQNADTIRAESCARIARASLHSRSYHLMACPYRKRASVRSGRRGGTVDSRRSPSLPVNTASSPSDSWSPSVFRLTRS